MVCWIHEVLTVCETMFSVVYMYQCLQFFQMTSSLEDLDTFSKAIPLINIEILAYTEAF